MVIHHKKHKRRTPKKKLVLDARGRSRGLRSPMRQRRKIIKGRHIGLERKKENE